MVWMLVGFFAYMVFILVVGIVAGKKTRGEMESFYLGDRKVGAWVTAISASASSESGWLVLGCVAMGYIHGASAYWIAVGCVLGFAFNWFVFAERIRAQSAESGALTVPEFLERKTGDRTKLIRVLGVLIIFVLMFTYVAAQLNAAGAALEAVFAWPYYVGVLIGAAITVLYTTFGGYRAVSWTDLWQGLLMAAALVVIPVITFFGLGGFGEIADRVNERPARPFLVLKGFVGDDYRVLRLEEGRPVEVENEGHTPGRMTISVEAGDGEERTIVARAGDDTFRTPAEGEATIPLRPIGLPDASLAVDATYSPTGGSAFFSLFGGMVGFVLLGWIIGSVGIGLGYPGSPHVVARFMAAASTTEIRRGRVIALVWAALAQGGAISMGILARARFPEIADPQGGLLVAAEHYLPGIVVGLIIAAVFAALRSTADSQLLVASSAVVHDFCSRVVGMEMDERRAMRISRSVVLALGILAVLLALTENRFIFWFVLFSWAGLGASFGPSLLLAVFWRRLSAAGVIASMVTGFATTLVWKLDLRSRIAEATATAESGGLDVYELIPAFFLSLLAAIVFSLLSPRREAPAPVPSQK